MNNPSEEIHLEFELTAREAEKWGPIYKINYQRAGHKRLPPYATLKSQCKYHAHYLVVSTKVKRTRE